MLRCPRMVPCPEGAEVFGTANNMAWSNTRLAIELGEMAGHLSL